MHDMLFGLNTLALDTIVLGDVLNDILVYSFRTIFFLSAILLMVIVLLQEGKGGGLASALGGQGAETFGVSTGGVNKVTMFLAGLFLFSGLAHALAFGQPLSKGIKVDRKPDAPLMGGTGLDNPLDGLEVGTDGGDEEEDGGTGEKPPEKTPPETPPPGNGDGNK